MKRGFVIWGEPQGKARPRFNGQTGRTYTPHKTKAYEQLVAETYKASGGQLIRAGAPISLRVTAYMEIAKSDAKWKQAAKHTGELRPTKKPDWDNIGKIIADALNGVAYADDAQVVEATVRKFYSMHPRVEVELETIGGDGDNGGAVINHTGGSGGNGCG